MLLQIHLQEFARDTGFEAEILWYAGDKKSVGCQRHLTQVCPQYKVLVILCLHRFIFSKYSTIII